MAILPNQTGGTSGQTLNVIGPGWKAKVKLLFLRGPGNDKELGFRSLFIERTPRLLGGKKVLTPRTLVAACKVIEMTIDLADIARWPASIPQKLNLADRSASADDSMTEIKQSDEVLLLLGIDAKKWGTDANKWPELCCLGGVIDLTKVDDLKIEGVSRSAPIANLFKSLELSVPEDPAALSVWADGSGLLLHVAVNLLWQPSESNPLPGWFRLGPRLLPGEISSVPALSLNRHRLTEDEKKVWAQKWSLLRDALIGTAPNRPVWVGLELDNDLPELVWPIKFSNASLSRDALQIDPKAISVVLRDGDFDPKKPQSGARSLARIAVEKTSLEISEDGLKLSLNSGSDDISEELTIHSSLDSGQWQNQLALTQFSLAFDPLLIPETLRQDQGLPRPESIKNNRSENSEDFLPQPLIWSFMPLANGWAQLPIPNLIEEHYLKAAKDQPESDKNILQGAVIFSGGNVKIDGTVPNPWDLTVTSAKTMTSTWTLTLNNNGLSLVGACVSLAKPNIILNGVLWLSTGRPRPEDALPDLEDWIAGLRGVTLRSIAAFHYPPMVRLISTVHLKAEIKDIQLSNWSFLYTVDADTFGQFDKLLPTDTFTKYLPLVWLRHPTLPTVQALPMTQSQVPANHPSASRSLAPFELPLESGQLPKAWLFECPDGQANKTWPSFSGPLTACSDWCKSDDALGMAIISLPGVVLLPTATKGMELLDLQYRYDLPYTDELHALAALSPLTDEGLNSAPPSGLTRETYANHWQTLTAKAALAALDARQAFPGNKANHDHVINLIEPYQWPVTVTLDQSSYPGSLLFSKPDGTVPLTLQGLTALEGISGHFSHISGSDTITMDSEGEMFVTAGSMVGLLKEGRMRDQRGLWRGIAGERISIVLITEVELEGQETRYLMTLLAAVKIQASGNEWHFWFKDLPANLNTLIYTFQPEKAEVDSMRQDINDPDAYSREQNYRLGYEWRFGPMSNNRSDPNADIIPLKINGLDFFPLALQQVRCDDKGLEQVVFRGRLQLPLPIEGTSGEQTAASNTVWATFTRSQGNTRLELSDLATGWLDEGTNERRSWPLTEQRNSSKDDGAPRIEWQTLSWDRPKKSLSIEKPILRYQLFGAERQYQFESINFTESDVIIVPSVSEQETKNKLFLKPPLLEINRKGFNGCHGLAVTLSIRLDRAFEVSDTEPDPTQVYEVQKGDSLWKIAKKFYGKGYLWQRIYRANRERIGSNPDLIKPGWILNIPEDFDAQQPTTTMNPKSLLSVDLPIILIPVDAPPPVKASIWGLEVEIKDHPQLSHDPAALQFKWQRFNQSVAPTLKNPIGLLPGMLLRSDDDADAPGFASLCFSPDLTLTSATLEILLPCSWGDLWPQQEALPKVKKVEDVEKKRLTLITQQLFQSSAGDLVCCYSARYPDSDDKWEDNFLISGVMEVNSLVSWPEEAAPNSDLNQLTIPGTDNANLSHTRHLSRILFNQHQLPVDLLIGGGERLLLNLQPLKAWQFLTEVEHWLFEVQDEEDTGNWPIISSRSWSAVQEVRLFRPAFFHARLKRMKEQNPHVFDPLEKLSHLSEADTGWFSKVLTDNLIPTLYGLPDDLLLIEASAPFWLRHKLLNDQQTSSLETLQFLPNGVQSCRLSQPEQFTPGGSAEGWLLLPMPFLGRLYNEPEATNDDPQIPLGGLANPLLIDPLKIIHDAPNQTTYPPLAMLLSHRRNGSSISVSFFPMDSYAAHTFAELDPASLASSWLAIQNPPEEQSALPGCIMSNLAQGSGRLSRQTTLEKLFSPCRDNQTSVSETPHDDIGLEMEWRPDALFTSSQIGLITNGALNDRVVGWHAIKLLLAGFTPVPPDNHVLHPAATLLPASCEASESSALQSLAVSPYSTISFERNTVSDSDLTLLSVFVELLSQTRNKIGLQPVAAQRLEPKSANNDTWEQQAQSWAVEIHQRLTPESPLAVMRMRQVFKANNKVLTRYGFLLTEGLKIIPTMERRAPPLRAEPALLRFREGQFGGQIIPDSMMEVELAAPLVTNPGPIYCRDDLESKGWPWGLSAFGIGIQYTENKNAIVEHSNSQTRWWQALQYRVQYRPGRSGLMTGGLPPSFRAPAIRTFLPVVSGLKLPESIPAQGQSVVPGSVRALLVGERCSAMIALRATLLKQDSQTTITSSSIPVQHRLLRPVELPVNSDPATALQPWASHFTPKINSLVSSSPADEAYFAPCMVQYTITQQSIDAYLAGWLPPDDSGARQEKLKKTFGSLLNNPIIGRELFIETVKQGLKIETVKQGLKNEDVTTDEEFTLNQSLILRHVQRTFGVGEPNRLQMTLTSPNYGELADDWDGSLNFTLVENPPLGDDVLSTSDRFEALLLTIAGTVYSLAKQTGGPAEKTVGFKVMEGEREKLRNALSQQQAGSVIVARVPVLSPIKNSYFKQTLEFPLRISHTSSARPPLRPTFIHFEDPEYNRKLSTPTAHITTIEKASDNQFYAVRLAADRREYSPDGMVILRYDWDDELITEEAMFEVKNRNTDKVALKFILKSGELGQIFLGDLKPQPKAGDTVLLTLNVTRPDQKKLWTVQLSIEITSKPTTPPPDSAYALLRLENDEIAENQKRLPCILYGWGVLPSHVDMVCPTDLLTDLVRRRAVFHWQDSERSNKKSSDRKVQKITQTGSTHFFNDC